MHFKRFAVLLLVSMVLHGCSLYKRMNRQEDCDHMIKDYNRLVRWQEAEKASIAFVYEKRRPTYNKSIEQLRRRGLSMADYRILSMQCMSDKKRAEATVEFDYYILPDNRLKTVTDHQTWIYQEANDQEPDLGEGWKLMSPLPEFK